MDLSELLLERKVINFDIDIMDSTVLACVLAAYCPFLVGEMFVTQGIYPQKKSRAITTPYISIPRADFPDSACSHLLQKS